MFQILNEEISPTLQKLKEVWKNQKGGKVGPSSPEKILSQLP